MKMLNFFKCIGCILLLAILFTSLSPAAVYAADGEEEVGTLESMVATLLNCLANGVNKMISLALRTNGFNR